MAQTIVISDEAQQIEELQRQVADLKDQLAQKQIELNKANCLIDRMKICRLFQMLTRQGLEVEWEKIKHKHPMLAIIYFDVDDMKALNARYRSAGVNQKIANAVKCIRIDDTIGRIGRVQFGDEVAAIVPKHQAQGFHDRIVESFRDQGIELTTAIGQCISEDLDANLEPLIAQVEAAKAEKKAERFVDRHDFPLELRQPPEVCPRGKSIS